MLSLRDLTVEFATPDGVVRAADGVSYDVDAGETLGVVGETGSGKSVTVLAALGLLSAGNVRRVAGEALLDGIDLLELPENELRRVLGRDVAMIFQDPMSALNPVQRVGDQIAETLRVHDRSLSARAARGRVVELLDLVGVPNPAGRYAEYPHQFSGGMCQRAVIAMAIANEPRVLIADEPTTALDVSVQAQILDVLRVAAAETGAATVLITHDLGVVAEVADRVCVMYAGRVVETGTVHDVFVQPQHPYTAALLTSLPRLDGATRRLVSIPGQPPDPIRLPRGCAFQPRCPVGSERAVCATERPPLATAGPGLSACHFPTEAAPLLRAAGSASGSAGTDAERAGAERGGATAHGGGTENPRSGETDAAHGGGQDTGPETTGSAQTTAGGPEPGHDGAHDGAGVSAEDTGLGTTGIAHAAVEGIAAGQAADGDARDRGAAGTDPVGERATETEAAAVEALAVEPAVGESAVQLPLTEADVAEPAIEEPHAGAPVTTSPTEPERPPEPDSPARAPVLDVREARKGFPIRTGVFARARGWVHAVDGVSFAIRPGRTLGLVGESGCGKSTLARMVLRLIDASGGSIAVEGGDLAAAGRSELRAIRRRVQMVYQDPFASLNPRLSVGDNVAEPLRLAGGYTRAQRRARVLDLFARVGLLPGHVDRFPAEFSGGQRQRVAIARALALQPRLLILDEPVSALDVSVQAQVLNLLADLQAESGMAYLFVSHDLSVVRQVADEVAVMYLGKIVESGPVDRIYGGSRHPYTQLLLASVPIPDPVGRESRQRAPLGGDVPSPADPPSGCRFRTRCPMAEARCAAEEPEPRLVDGVSTACHHAERVTPAALSAARALQQERTVSS